MSSTKEVPRPGVKRSREEVNESSSTGSNKISNGHGVSKSSPQANKRLKVDTLAVHDGAGVESEAATISTPAPSVVASETIQDKTSDQKGKLVTPVTKEPGSSFMSFSGYAAAKPAVASEVGTVKHGGALILAAKNGGKVPTSNSSSGSNDNADGVPSKSSFLDFGNGSDFSFGAKADKTDASEGSSSNPFFSTNAGAATGGGAWQWGQSTADASDCAASSNTAASSGGAWAWGDMAKTSIDTPSTAAGSASSVWNWGDTGKVGATSGKESSNIGDTHTNADKAARSSLSSATNGSATATTAINGASSSFLGASSTTNAADRDNDAPDALKLRAQHQVSNGEDHERQVAQIQRVRVFALRPIVVDGETVQRFKECGIGKLRINVPLDAKGSDRSSKGANRRWPRLILRNEGSKRVVVNELLIPEFTSVDKLGAKNIRVSFFSASVAAESQVVSPEKPDVSGQDDEMASTTTPTTATTKTTTTTPAPPAAAATTTTTTTTMSCCNTYLFRFSRADESQRMWKDLVRHTTESNVAATKQ